VIPKELHRWALHLLFLSPPSTSKSVGLWAGFTHFFLLFHSVFPVFSPFLSGPPWVSPLNQLFSFFSRTLGSVRHQKIWNPGPPPLYWGFGSFALLLLTICRLTFLFGNPKDRVPGNSGILAVLSRSLRVPVFPIFSPFVPFFFFGRAWTDSASLSTHF